MPTTPLPACKAEDDHAALTAQRNRNTFPFNLTGLPAISLPCGFTDGLPIGLQLVGRPFDEATVLRVAHAYEQATDWHTRRPPPVQ
jgi:aspartyl-tRNA(Asn)/glutamyl-tRNA(Gln) amidotransferase subunit A